MADFSSESLDLQKKVKEEDDNIKPMKEFESPEKLYDELIASVRKYHPSTPRLRPRRPRLRPRGRGRTIFRSRQIYH